MVPVVYGLLLFSGPPAIAQEGVHKDVPYVPTPPAVVETMLKLGEVRKGDILYDLGCGDGRIVVMAAQKFGIARGTGIDIDPDRIKDTHMPGGWSPPGVRNGAIKGHEFGLKLTPREREQLLAFLRTL